ncbi:MAG: head maturation protease, ClpP-related [Sulfitobacter sp.]
MDGDDLIFNGEIVLDGAVVPHDWCMWPEDRCFSSRMVREALSHFTGNVKVRVNSGGGDPVEGEAIRAAFDAHPGQITVVVSGQASSAASLMIMAADRIEMTAGSIIMIHDPSACLCGNADDLRREASVLDTISDIYASVYASRSGQTAEEIRTLMQSETWFGPDAAVEAGFADAVVGVESSGMAPDDPALVAAMSVHSQTISMLRMCAAKANAQPDTPAAQMTGRSGQTSAMSATTILETVMEPDTINDPATIPEGQTSPATSVVGDQLTMQAPDTAAIEARGAQLERDRQRGIREMSAPFMASGLLTVAQVDIVINEGASVADASTRLMATMAAAQPLDGPAAVPARARGNERDPSCEGMINALMRNYDGPGAEFRGMRMRGLAMHLAGPSRGYSDTEAIRQGMLSTTMMGGAHGVSDFAYITSEVMNRTLIAEYSRRASQWNLVTGAPMTASDFREMHAARFGGDFQLKDVTALGNYQEAVLDDQAEGLKVKRKGRTISLTFEAVVNDDMGAFMRIPGEFALAARQMENSMVWALFRLNAAMKSDSKALFHADHSNLNAGSAGVINVARVGAMRKAMWEQRAFGSKDKDDFLDISPDRLIVPPALETAAGQFVRPITPAKDSDGNPYKDTLTPHTVPNLGAAAGGSDSAWYLISSDLPPIAVANLEGYEAPTVQTIEGMNPDKVTMNARHIFGAAAVEYRGAQKNNG